MSQHEQKRTHSAEQVGGGVDDVQLEAATGRAGPRHDVEPCQARASARSTRVTVVLVAPESRQQDHLHSHALVALP